MWWTWYSSLLSATQMSCLGLDWSSLKRLDWSSLKKSWQTVFSGKICDFSWKSTLWRALSWNVSSFYFINLPSTIMSVDVSFWRASFITKLDGVHKRKVWANKRKHKMSFCFLSKGARELKEIAVCNISNIARIANAVQVTIWLYITAPQSKSKSKSLSLSL